MFHDRLISETSADMDALFDVPFVRSAVAGELDLATYRAFLGQAYHHVKETVPLLMACGARLDGRYEWLRGALGEYVREEHGHHEWILDDLRATGADPEPVRNGSPDLPCELMCAYAWDVAARRNPLGLFGMVRVLEGASVRGASSAAARLEARLGLPAAAFTYLSSHGELDREHVGFFESLMNRIEDPADQDWIVRCAHVFSRLYGDVFRGLLPETSPGRMAVAS